LYIPSANGKQGPAALTNKKHENIDQIQAKNRDIADWGWHYPQDNFPEVGYLNNLKPAATPFSRLDLSTVCMSIS
jgi:hypothetical protein